MFEQFLNLLMVWIFRACVAAIIWLVHQIYDITTLTTLNYFQESKLHKTSVVLFIYKLNTLRIWAIISRICPRRGRVVAKQNASSLYSTLVIILISDTVLHNKLFSRPCWVLAQRLNQKKQLMIWKYKKLSVISSNYMK